MNNFVVNAMVHTISYSLKMFAMLIESLFGTVKPQRNLCNGVTFESEKEYDVLQRLSEANLTRPDTQNYIAPGARKKVWFNQHQLTEVQEVPRLPKMSKSAMADEWDRFGEYIRVIGRAQRKTPEILEEELVEDIAIRIERLKRNMYRRMMSMR